MNFVDMMRMKESNLTEGSIFLKLILFSLPMIAGNLLQQLYSFMDTLIVGRFVGSDALAAVGASYAFMTFITSIIIGLCMGSSTFFSSDYGANALQQLKVDVVHAFVFVLLVTLVIYGIVYPGLDMILRFLSVPSSIFAMTRSYVWFVSLGIFFTFLYNFFSFLLRSIGNSTVPLVFLAISSVLNIVLDIVFVTTFSMGVNGVAIATVLSQMLSGIGIMVYAYRTMPVLHMLKNVSLNMQRLKQIIVTGVSTGLQQSVMNFGILMIQGLVNSFGATIMAAFAAAVKIDSLAYMPAQEFGNASSLFLSQNFGANKMDRIQKGIKLSFLISVLFCLCVSIGIYFSAPLLMQLFVSSKEVQIITEGTNYLRIEGTMYVGIGILFLWYGYFRAIEKPNISLLLTILSLGTRVALSYGLANQFGVNIIWYSIPIGWILADVIGLILYKKNTKKIEIC